MSAMSIPPAVPLPDLPHGQLANAVRALAAGLRDKRDRRWRELLGPVRGAFNAHCRATEGEQGLYADVVLDAPRLARKVDCLVAEHEELDTAMASLAQAVERVDADATTLRAEARKVLDGLVRHRQHDTDLVYEAYTTDIGGE
jgi:hypothetical protein